MTEASRDLPGNPSAIHFHGRAAKAAIEEARKIIANALHASVGEIFFTSGGTEANNFAIKSSIADLEIKRIITSRIEHPSVLNAVAHVAEQHGIPTEYVDLDIHGRTAPGALHHMLHDKSDRAFVSLMHANNELGTMNDIGSLSTVCKNAGAVFHSDTVQTIAHKPIDFSEMDVAMASASAHKFGGPKGIGFIFISQDYIVRPQIDGGGQERNLRAGTENVAGIIGMAKAVQHSVSHMASQSTHTFEVRRYLHRKICEHFPEAKINGDHAGHSLDGVLSVTFPLTQRTELLVFNLDIEGISVSGGSACSSGVEKASHVLAHLFPDDTGITVRFSLSTSNTTEEVDFTIKKLHKILHK
ncbi:UNVERIFIED_CONTAM: hypothetical protein GTU68_028337 [Idotea baltica]|nr:hypothetical protein [Idotea baltica]